MEFSANLAVLDRVLASGEIIWTDEEQKNTPCEQLHISDRIALLGYSAGGMLLANGATHYDAGNPQADDPVERQSCRPDAVVLCMMRLPRLRSRAGCLKIPSAMAGRSGFVWRQRRTSPPTRRRFSSGRLSLTIRDTDWPMPKS